MFFKNRKEIWLLDSNTQTVIFTHIFSPTSGSMMNLVNSKVLSNLFRATFFLTTNRSRPCGAVLAGKRTLCYQKNIMSQHHSNTKYYVPVSLAQLHSPVVFMTFEGQHNDNFLTVFSVHTDNKPMSLLAYAAREYCLRYRRSQSA